MEERKDIGIILRLCAWWRKATPPGAVHGFLMDQLPSFYDFLRSIRFSTGVQYADVFKLLFSFWRRSDL
jgi:hypothetical protein